MSADPSDTIAELRALEAAATPGPWSNAHEGLQGGEVVRAGDVRVTRVYMNESGWRGCQNAALIAAMRNALPELLDAAERVDRLEFELSEAQADLDNEREFREGDRRLADRWAERAQTAEVERDRLRERVAAVQALADDARRSSGGPYVATVDVLSLERALGVTP